MTNHMLNKLGVRYFFFFFFLIFLKNFIEGVCYFELGVCIGWVEKNPTQPNPTNYKGQNQPIWIELD